MKILRTDNGREDLSKKFTRYFDAKGIKHQLTTPYTPQQNGIAERANRTIVERARCLLYDADLPKRFWAEASSMAVYLMNRSVNSNKLDITPEELWSGKKVDLSKLKLFGTRIMVHVPKEKRQKWDYKSEALIFVGYDENTKGYRCINRETGKIMLSRDVKFLEEENHKIGYIEQVSVADDCTMETNNVEVEDIDETQDTNLTTDSEITFEDSNDIDYVPDETLNQSEQTPQAVTRSKSNAIFPGWLHGNLAMICSENFVFKCDETEHIDDPITVKEVSTRPDKENWINAMKEEYQSLIDNNTWVMTQAPKGAKLIKTKWVFKTKRDNDGEIVRYKARMVAKGYTQRFGIDYEDTYAPVVRYASVRFLMAVAVQKNLKIHQLDAITAFLQGELNEEIYLEQPEGFHDGTNRACLLKKAIYGLKQAGRQWNKKLDATLKKSGLRSCKMDPCIYYTDDHSLIIAIYVHDFLVFHQQWNSAITPSV